MSARAGASGALDENLISPMGWRRDWLSPSVVLLVALGTRLWVLLKVDSGIVFSKYPVFAKQIVAGKDIGNRWLDLSPFYLWFWTVVGPALRWNFFWLKGLQLMVGVAAALLVWAVARHWLRPPYALGAALLYAAYGYLPVLELTFEPEVFVILFNLASVFFLQRMTVNRWRGSAMLAGVCIGLAVITKPNSLLWLPCAWCWFALCTEWPARKRLAGAALLTLMATLVVAPIPVRNLVRFAEPVLITADFGKVFYHGNYHTATALYAAPPPVQERDPTGGLRPDYDHETFRSTASRLAGRPLSAAESSSFWFSQTLQDMADHPGAYVQRQLGKLLFFFHTYEIALTPTEFLGYRTLRSYPHLPFGVLSVLGLAGMGLWLGSPDRRRTFLALAGIGVTFVTCLVFYVIARYRCPAVPWLCVMSGFAIERGVLLWRTGRRKHCLGVGLAIVLMAVPIFFSSAGELEQMDREMTNFFFNSIRF